MWIDRQFCYFSNSTNICWEIVSARSRRDNIGTNIVRVESWVKVAVIQSLWLPTPSMLNARSSEGCRVLVLWETKLLEWERDQQLWKGDRKGTEDFPVHSSFTMTVYIILTVILSHSVTLAWLGYKATQSLPWPINAKHHAKEWQVYIL